VTKQAHIWQLVSCMSGQTDRLTTVLRCSKLIRSKIHTLYLSVAQGACPTEAKP